MPEMQCPEEGCKWTTGKVQEAVMAVVLDHHLKTRHQGPRRAEGTRPTAGAAAIVGRLNPCDLGRDKLKRYKIFKDWIGNAEAKMKLLGITDSDGKTDFITSCAGAELTSFWEKEIRIRKEKVGEEEKHTYDQIVEETKKGILRYVNRDRALIDLLHIPQGSRQVTEFLSQVEDQAALCRVEENPITEDDL